ncbi:MAG TPA: CBS domain-containing protein [Myxococcota bacterium]|nr:CBS domain-containing protein [Myxococcota bacterium]
MDLAQHRHMPPVSTLMTPFPYFVGPDDPVARVLELMREHDIRHVPVKKDDRVIGLISQSDLRWLTDPNRGAIDPASVRVRDVPVPPPYAVELSAPLGPVLLEMARLRVSSAIVLRSGRLAGIVTETDVCRALGQVLERRFPPGGGGDAA